MSYSTYLLYVYSIMQNKDKSNYLQYLQNLFSKSIGIVPATQKNQFS